MWIFDMLRKRKKLDAPWAKYYTYEDLNRRIPDISMYDAIIKSTKRYPNNIAIKYLGKKISYKAFFKED